MKPVHKRNGVIADLTGIYSWIGERNIDAAERFLVAVDRTFEQIARHPQIGWVRQWRSKKLRGMRSWRVDSFENFLVFYRDESAIEIYAVLRGCRRFEGLLRKR